MHNTTIANNKISNQEKSCHAASSCDMLKDTCQMLVSSANIEIVFAISVWK